MTEDDRDAPRSRTLGSGFRHAGMGLQLVLVIGLFGGTGWWLDGRLGTVPLFTILGSMGGSAAWFYSIYQHLVVEPRRKAREEAAGKAARQRGPSRDDGGSR